MGLEWNLELVFLLNLLDGWAWLTVEGISCSDQRDFYADLSTSLSNDQVLSKEGVRL